MATLALVAVGCGDDDATGADSGVADAGSDAMPTDTGGTDSGEMDAGDIDSGGGGEMCVSITFVVGDDHPQPHAEGISFPAEHVAMGVEQVYDIQGASAHPHTLTVTPDNFAALARGETVTITSTNDGLFPHTHDVMLTCALS